MILPTGLTVGGRYENPVLNLVVKRAEELPTLNALLAEPTIV
jgi:hypothetical protein